MNKKIIGNNIQTLRNICGMTQAELAEKAGVSTDHISHIEIGSGSVSLPLLLEICRLLNTTPNDILLNELSPASPVEQGNVSKKSPFHSASSDKSTNPDEILLLNIMQHFIEKRKENLTIHPKDDSL